MSSTSAPMGTDVSSAIPSAKVSPWIWMVIRSLLVMTDGQPNSQDMIGTLKKCLIGPGITDTFRRFHSPVGLYRVTHVKGVKLPVCCVRQSADDPESAPLPRGLLPEIFEVMIYHNFCEVSGGKLVVL